MFCVCIWINWRRGRRKKGASGAEEEEEEEEQEEEEEEEEEGPFPRSYEGQTRAEGRRREKRKSKTTSPLPLSLPPSFCWSITLVGEIVLGEKGREEAGGATQASRRVCKAKGGGRGKEKTIF